MPRIQVYQPQENAPTFNPSKRYAPALTGAGLQDIAQGASQLGGAITKAVEANELSKLSANASSTMADLSKKWEQTKLSADPNDTTTADKFMQDQVQPAVDKLSDGLSTRGAKLQAQQMTARIKGDILVRSNSDMAGIAGEAAKANYLSTVENLADTTVTDPSSLGSVLDMHEQALNGLKGKLTAGQIDMLRVQGNIQISRSAAEGMIDSNPEQFLADAKAGKYDGLMKGTQKATIIHQAEVRIRANATEARMNAALAREEANARSEATRNQYTTKMADLFENPSMAQGLVIQAFKDPNMKPEDKASIYHLAESVANGSANEKTDSSLFTSLNSRVLLDPGDPNRPTAEEVYKNVGAGLKISDANYLVDRLNGKGSQSRKVENDLVKNYLSAVSKTIAPNRDAFGNMTGDGQQAYTDYLSYFYREYNERIAQGKTPAQLLNSDSPDFMGKPEALEHFRPDPARAADNLRRQMEEVKAAASALKTDNTGQPKPKKSLDDIFGGK